MDIVILCNAERRTVQIIPAYYIPTHEEVDLAIELLRAYKDKWTSEEIHETNVKIEEEVKGLASQKKGTPSGFIYLVKSENLYKIGRTKYPRRRIDKYRTENPHIIESVLLSKISDYIEVEKEILRLMSDKKHHGEWFNFSSTDVDQVASFLLQKE